MLITASIAEVWGDGTTSSSDGQFFRGGKRAATGGDINARYGVDPGFSFYTHVSDQHGPYHVKGISAATHEAPYVLDGLLHHGSDLNLAEHYTDTGGAIDHVFALCAMLGFRIGGLSRSISLPPTAALHRFWGSEFAPMSFASTGMRSYGWSRR